MTSRKGQCLCGSVRFAVTQLNNSVDVCHCSMCRNWGGGPLMSVRHDDDIEFETKENVTIYDSSAWAERGFCSKCGSHLFYRIKETGMHEIPVGLFADQSAFKLDLQVFVDSKPSFYSFKNRTKEMTEAQVLEHFGNGKNT